MSKEKRKRMAVVLDDFSDMDQIGYDEYSEGLVEMIRSVGAKGEKGSFTIGVFGQWGQGKTSMLRQIEKKLNEIETTDEKKSYRFGSIPGSLPVKNILLFHFFIPWSPTCKNLKNLKRKKVKAFHSGLLIF
jgi:hypothetical protein